MIVLNKGLLSCSASGRVNFALTLDKGAVVQRPEEGRIVAWPIRVLGVAHLLEQSMTGISQAGEPRSVNRASEAPQQLVMVHKGVGCKGKFKAQAWHD